MTHNNKGFLNAKESVKARKQKGNEAMRNVKNKVIYHSEMFLECPVSCSEPMIIEAVRSRKTVGRDGKMTRDIVGCALLDITKLSDDEEVTHPPPARAHPLLLVLLVNARGSLGGTYGSNEASRHQVHPLSSSAAS